ncbi:MAG TPA: hypothetical protein PLL69_02145 [Gemmatimonadales bacterium]|nr:hypothetical protein [Gemmatimonadales bacterium]
MVATTRRQRITRATAAGLIAAAVASAIQYFVAIPVGGQPDWLWMVTLLSAVPSAYLTFPLSDSFQQIMQVRLGSGQLVEVSTPFGPALRVGMEDIALVALGTTVMIGLVVYLASGISELYDEGWR